MLRVYNPGPGLTLRFETKQGRFDARGRLVEAEPPWLVRTGTGLHGWHAAYAAALLYFILRGSGFRGSGLRKETQKQRNKLRTPPNFLVSPGAAMATIDETATLLVEAMPKLSKQQIIL